MLSNVQLFLGFGINNILEDLTFYTVSFHQSFLLVVEEMWVMKTLQRIVQLHLVCFTCYDCR